MTEELKQDMLHTIDTKVRYDNLFWWFENNLFKNEGNYPRNTNLVFEFDDWVRKVDKSELAARLGFYSDYKDTDDAEKRAEQARIEMLNGVDMWVRA